MNKPNHRHFDLQLFADEPIDPIEPIEPIMANEHAEPTEEAFLEIKYNKEQIRLDKEKAKELAQKGMNYDKVLEKLQSLESDPRLSFVEKQAQRHGLSVEDYLVKVQEQEEQERLNELIQQNIPEEYAKKLLKVDEIEKKLSQQEKEQQEKAKRESDFKAFLDTFPGIKPEEIPQSVWLDVDKGLSLVDAYTRYDYQNLKAKLEETSKVNQQNNENANASTGRVDGSTQTPTYFTPEQVNKMSEKEVNKHWDVIMKSQKIWMKDRG